MFSLKKFDKIIMPEHGLLQCNISGDLNSYYFTLNKSVISKIAKLAKINSVTSENLFKTDAVAWREFYKTNLPENFDFSNYSLIVVNNEDFYSAGRVVDIVVTNDSFDTNTQINNFEDFYRDDTKYFENKSTDTLTLKKEFDSGSDKFKSHIIITDINVETSKYQIYFGVRLNDNNIVLLPSPRIKTSKFDEFIKYDLSYDHLSFKTTVDLFVDDFNALDLSSMKISVNEILGFISLLKLDIHVNPKTCFLDDVLDLENRNSVLIRDGINSLGIPYKSLKTDLKLRKMLIVTKLTLQDMLNIFSEELKDKVTTTTSGEVLAKISELAFNSTTDEAVAAKVLGLVN